MIQDLFNALVAKMPAGFPIFLGRQHLRAHDAPPRIVLVPTVEQLGPPEHGRDAAGHPLKGVSTRMPTLAAHLWGRDLAEAEGLLHDLVNILQRVTGVSATLGAAFWLDQEQAGSWLNAGEVYVLPIQFKTQITQDATFATLAAIAQESLVEE